MKQSKTVVKKSVVKQPKKAEPKLIYPIEPSYNKKPNGWYDQGDYKGLVIDDKEIAQAWEGGSIVLNETPPLTDIEAMALAERIAHLILAKP